MTAIIDPPFVDILLSTYNGEKYLSEQLDSIVNQEYKHWSLLVRDDGSTDSTLAIVKTYVAKYPDKIQIIENQTGNFGSLKSYLMLMASSSAPYIAFCDQDDSWDINKLSQQVGVIAGAEKQYGANIPILVHSDSKIVNEDLELLSESQWKYQKTHPDKMTSLNRLLVQNCVTGCTTIINKELLKLGRSLKNPEKVIMHDWWLALIAAANGRIISMPVPLLRYRQHSDNRIGSRKWGLINTMGVLKNGPADLRARVLATKKQAEELLASDILTSEANIVVKRFVELFRLNWLMRRIELAQHGHFKYGFMRNLAMFLVI